MDAGRDAIYKRAKDGTHVDFRTIGRSTEHPSQRRLDWHGYKAGYEARLAGAVELSTGLSAWKAGWHDADMELMASERQQRAPESADLDLKAVGAELYSVGGNARIHDIPFDAARTRPWKLGWSDTDLTTASGS